MDNKLKEIVENGTIEYLKNKVILPILNDFTKYYDERCYNIFTKELASIFEEYQPDYFENDYHSRVGQYFFSSLYGYHVTEEMLIEIIKAEEDDRFEGIDVLFADFSSLDVTAESSVRDMVIKFDYTDELMRVIILHHLNKNNQYINT